MKELSGGEKESIVTNLAFLYLSVGDYDNASRIYAQYQDKFSTGAYEAQALVDSLESYSGKNQPINGAAKENASFVAMQSDNYLTPAQFGLDQNYPNPFNPETSIQYQIPEVSSVQIKIYHLRRN